MTVEQVLTSEFCELLEYRISQALAQSSEVWNRRYWCDGILMPEISDGYSIEQIRKSQQISARAWMCEGSKTQEVFQLFIKLSLSSMKALIQGKPLQSFIPIGAAEAWVLLDWEVKSIVVQML
jgi:hypothetical protein